MTATKRTSPVDKKIVYEGLTNPVSPVEVRQYRKQHLPKRIRIIVTSLTVLPAIVFTIVGMLILTDNTTTAVSKSIGFFISCLFGAGLSIAIGMGYRFSSTKGVKLARFAQDNGWKFNGVVSNPAHEGLIFKQGHTRQSQEVIYDTGNPATAAFEIGKHQYTIGSGKNQRTYTWLYCCIELDRHVPHMVLDATANNATLFGRSWISSLPVSFKKDQILELEGDFNTHFTLYAPIEYKRDAYYIFTPNLMAQLIDHSRTFDAEVVDNRLYVYSRLPARDMDLTDPSFMYKLLNIIHTVGMTTHRQTDYYSDEKVGDRTQDRVDSSGQRLRRRAGWLSLIIALVFVTFYVLITLVNFL